jgi:Cys-rich repeat protein
VDKHTSILTALFVAVVSLAAAGCELVASGDTNLIAGTGGAGGATTGTTTGTTTSSTTGTTTSTTTGTTTSSTTGTTSTTTSTTTSSTGSGMGGMPGCDGGPACMVDGDCQGDANGCVAGACISACCGTSDVDAGTSCPGPDGGAEEVCDGNGNCVACNVPADCAAQATVCVTNTCMGNACGTTNAAVGTACADSGGVVCDGSGICVGCNTSADCSGGAVCETGGNTCVGCNADADCAGGEVCDTEASACVQCNTSADCAGGDVCKTGGNTCVRCNVDADCAGGEVCDTESNACVQCNTSADCTGGEVCKTGGNTCVTCNTSADCTGGEVCKTGGNTCVTCNTSADCTDGMLCVVEANACVQCIRPTDCAPQTTTCKSDTCTAHACGVTDASQGTACSDSGGVVCDGAGTCVACNVDADCPSPAPICVAGACLAPTTLTNLELIDLPNGWIVSGNCGEFKLFVYDASDTLLDPAVGADLSIPLAPGTYTYTLLGAGYTDNGGSDPNLASLNITTSAGGFQVTTAALGGPVTLGDITLQVTSFVAGEQAGSDNVSPCSTSPSSTPEILATVTLVSAPAP